VRLNEQASHSSRARRYIRLSHQRDLQALSRLYRRHAASHAPAFIQYWRSGRMQRYGSLCVALLASSSFLLSKTSLRAALYAIGRTAPSRVLRGAARCDHSLGLHALRASPRSRRHAPDRLHGAGLSGMGDPLLFTSMRRSRSAGASILGGSGTLRPDRGALRPYYLTGLLPALTSRMARAHGLRPVILITVSLASEAFRFCAPSAPSYSAPAAERTP